MRKKSKGMPKNGLIVLMSWVLVGVMLVYSLGGLVEWFFSADVRKAERAKYEADFSDFADELNIAKRRVGKFPTNEEWLQQTYEAKPPPPSFSLNSPIRTESMVYYHEAPSDPWGMPYQYACPSSKTGREYDLYSLGPDKVPSDDDIYYDPAAE